MNTFLIKEWFLYFHLKTDEHALHSPFFYNFYTSLIKKKTSAEIASIEGIRKSFLSNKQLITLTDYGAGSQLTSSNQRTIASIAKYSLTSKKFSAFLLRLIEKFKPQNIIELGTSLGINTAYMAQFPLAKVHSFEGDPEILRQAKGHLNKYQNLSLIEGNIDETLPYFLRNFEHMVDLAYVDANHTYKATLNYFDLLAPFFNQHSICIIDDIHWSAEMNRAWETLKLKPEVTASIDLFDAGILFFNTDFNQQNLILHF